MSMVKRYLDTRLTVNLWDIEYVAGSILDAVIVLPPMPASYPRRATASQHEKRHGVMIVSEGRALP